jgi:hypothetical protein
MMRSHTCRTRCAAQPAWLSSNPGLTLLAFIFIAGAALFTLGTFMGRREAAAQTPDPSVTLSWSLGDLETRIDQIERLAMVGQPWCVEELRTLLTDTDERVRNAAEDAILVIQARGIQ